MKNPFRFKKKDNVSSEDKNESFGEKLKQFFSAEPQKEKVLRHEDFNAAGDVYYASVSAFYKVAQRVLCLVLVAFLLIAIATNFSEITYDNFFYLVRDLSGTVNSDGTMYETLSYESDSRQNFCLYRGGVATVSPSKISIFTATGRRTLNSTSSFSSPHLISSNKYVLVYDTSGTTFSVYNSFSRVYTETLDYPITDACFAEDGSFVIVTRTADSRSVIRSYNKRFELTAELSADYYVFDISISKEQNRLAILSYGLGDGTGEAVLSIRNADTLKQTDSVKLNGEFPIACGFLEHERIALITDSYARILEEDLSVRDISRDYSSGNVTGYHLSSQGVAVSVAISSINHVVAFDKSGMTLYNSAVSYTVSDVSVFDGFVFLQTEQGIVRIDSASDQSEVLSCGHGKLLIYSADTALVCGESKAEYLIFDK